MRRLLEVYRWMTLAAFFISGAILALPLAALFMTGTVFQWAPGINGLVGIALLAGTFAASGFNVIAIAIYDQVRALTTEVEYTRTELAYLREELRDRA